MSTYVKIACLSLSPQRRQLSNSMFSSRRRHTRYIGDWSSDVCSSDLTPPAPVKYISNDFPDDIPDDREKILPGDKVILIVEDDTSFAKILLDRKSVV